MTYIKLVLPAEMFYSTWTPKQTLCTKLFHRTLGILQLFLSFSLQISRSSRSAGHLVVLKIRIPKQETVGTNDSNVVVYIQYGGNVYDVTPLDWWFVAIETKQVLANDL